MKMWAKREFAWTPEEVQNCYDSADQTWKEIEEPFSPKYFWGADLETWRRLVPMIVVPPLLLYAFAAVIQWIWRGFKPRARSGQTG